jgi:hypothetical protein
MVTQITTSSLARAMGVSPKQVENIVEEAGIKRLSYSRLKMYDIEDVRSALLRVGYNYKTVDEIIDRAVDDYEKRMSRKVSEVDDEE